MKAARGDPAGGAGDRQDGPAEGVIDVAGRQGSTMARIGPGTTRRAKAPGIGVGPPLRPTNSIQPPPCPAGPIVN
jgi:hypothetical protein